MNWRANNGYIPRGLIGYLLLLFLGVRSRKAEGVLVMSTEKDTDLAIETLKEAIQALKDLGLMTQEDEDNG